MGPFLCCCSCLLLAYYRPIENSVKMMKRDQGGCNQVFQDKIWRDYIAREWWRAIEWPKKYGYLSEESKLLQRQILEHRHGTEAVAAVSGNESSPGSSSDGDR